MKPLVKCLKVPLFLCMFCYEHPEDGVRLPETPGEILYNFSMATRPFIMPENGRLIPTQTR